MAILKPWCGVWTAATMSAFLAQNVVPKVRLFYLHPISIQTSPLLLICILSLENEYLRLTSEG